MHLLRRLAERVARPLIDARVQEALRLRAAALEDEDRGWTRLTGNPERDLTPIKHDRMLAVAYHLYDENPLAKWLVETTADFVVSEGVQIRAEAEGVQEILKAFWNDPINNWDVKLPRKVMELGICGEQCWPVFVNEATGLVRLGVVDPARIAAVEHDPDNAEAAIGVRLKGRGGHRGLRYRVIYPAPDEELFAERARLRRQEQYTDGDCFWFKINSVSTATRGRSDLFALGDWIDGYEQFLFNTLDRTGYLNAFVWDVLLQGKTEEEIQAWLDAHPPPKPGSMFAHNEQVSMEARTPNLGGADTAEHARTFRNHVLGGAGIPEHWYGGAGDVNLATAQAMGLPTFKRLQRRQRLVKYIVEYVLRYQVQQGEIAGAIRGRDLAFEVLVPQLQNEDLTRVAAAAQQLTMALAIAEDRGWIDPGTSQRVFAAIVGRTGVEIPLDAVAARAEAMVTPDYRSNGRAAVSGQ